MESWFKWLMIDSAWAKEVGLAVIRVGIGFTFIKHGYGKVFGGFDEWRWLGEQMRYIGITCTPIFWGIAAALSEFFGGILLTIGLGTRVAVFFLAFTMFVAVMHHIRKGDSWGYISFPLSLMIVFIGFLIAGGGLYSLDYYYENFS